MSDTSTSLLDRLRYEPDQADWNRLADVYSPLIRNWLRRYDVNSEDGNDVVQEVMMVVVRRLSEFEHNNRTGAFRNWLRTITVNCLRDFWRAQRIRPKAQGGSDFQLILAEMEDPTSNLSQIWNQEHDLHVTKHLLKQIQTEFNEKTWEAFSLVVQEGVAPKDAAAQLGTTVNAVFIAKSRVLARLREEAKGLLDE
ncbi:MAG: RNA polymerase sigma factor [Gemmataceae bacterium]